MLAWVVTIHSSSNVTQLADELGKFVTDAIPGFDAITGSDMTSECMNTVLQVIS